MPGAKGMFAMWCRALRPIGLFSPVIRQMELWDIGVMFDGDVEGPGPAFVMPRGEVQTPDERPAPRIEVD